MQQASFNLETAAELPNEAGDARGAKRPREEEPGAQPEKRISNTFSHSAHRIDSIAALRASAFRQHASVWFGREVTTQPQGSDLSSVVQDLLTEVQAGTKGSDKEVKALRRNLRLIQARLEDLRFGEVQAVKSIKEVLSSLKPTTELAQIDLTRETDLKRLFAYLEEAVAHDRKDEVIQCVKRLLPSTLYRDSPTDEVKQLLRAILHIVKPYSVRGELGADVQILLDTIQTGLILEPFRAFREQGVAADRSKEFLEKVVDAIRELEELPRVQQSFEEDIWKGLLEGKIAISEQDLQSYLAKLQISYSYRS